MRKGGLSANAIKYIAIIAMLLDHIAWYFLAFSSPLAQVFHVVGRITAPVMCFFIAEGYHYTKDVKKYAGRLFLFALISQIPWYMVHNNFWTFSFNMMFTLLLGLISIAAVDKIESKTLSVLIVILCCFLSCYCDWSITAILWCVLFYKFRDDKKKNVIAFSIVAVITFARNIILNLSNYNNIGSALKSSLFVLGIFLSLILLLNYNGEKGGSKYSKWVFYVFYPLHLLVIGIILKAA